MGHSRPVQRAKLAVRLVGGIVVALAVDAAAAQSAGSAIAIKTDRFVNEKGELVEGGLVLAGGKIKQVAGPLPADAVLHEYVGAVACPGLIDALGALGAADNLTQDVTSTEPNASALDAFDRYSGQIRAALEAGVTAFALAPRDDNVIAGQIAICRTSGPGGEPAILIPVGPLMTSLAPRVLRYDREPTARAGAIELLRQRFAGAKTGDPSPIGAVLGGKKSVFVSTPAAADVAAALQLFGSLKVKPILLHTDDARDIATDVNDAAAGVIVGPLDLYASQRAALAAGLFDKAGAPVAIAGGLPGAPANSLRVGAAIAARNGLSAAAARRAITIVPANLLGVGDRLGALKPGCLADVVVFSGDPLDLRARVLAVYVDGQRVYVAPETAPLAAQR